MFRFCCLFDSLMHTHNCNSSYPSIPNQNSSYLDSPRTIYYHSLSHNNHKVFWFSSSYSLFTLSHKITNLLSFTNLHSDSFSLTLQHVFIKSYMNEFFSSFNLKKVMTYHIGVFCLFFFYFLQNALHVRIFLCKLFFVFTQNSSMPSTVARSALIFFYFS